MRKYTTVENAVSIATDYLNSLGNEYDVDILRKNIYSWYSHSDVTNAFVLAACGVVGEWFPTATYEYMLAVRNLLLPCGV